LERPTSAVRALRNDHQAIKIPSRGPRGIEPAGQLCSVGMRRTIGVCGDHVPERAGMLESCLLFANRDCRNETLVSLSICLLCIANLPFGSRPTDPCSTAVGMKAYSTPVLNHRFIRISRLNNRYCNQDLQERQTGRRLTTCASRSPPRPSTRCGISLSRR